MHEPTPPTIDEHGAETHPAWGALGASRISSNPGSVLFDSDVLHRHFVRVRLGRMTRTRQDGHDYLHGGVRDLIEVDLSEAQWASFVSSMNVGLGVPCTIRATETQHDVPGIEFAPRLALSLDDVKSSADRAFGRIQEAMRAVDELDPKAGAAARREAMSKLRTAIDHSTGNVSYAAETLIEHTENVVQRARADIEAMVVDKATQIGIDPAGVTAGLVLGGGSESVAEVEG